MPPKHQGLGFYLGSATCEHFEMADDGDCFFGCLEDIFRADGFRTVNGGESETVQSLRDVWAGGTTEEEFNTMKSLAALNLPGDEWMDPFRKYDTRMRSSSLVRKRKTRSTADADSKHTLDDASVSYSLHLPNTRTQNKLTTSTCNNNRSWSRS